MYKISLNKELFDNIYSKKITILEKENTKYWKKELLEPIFTDNKLTYIIKQVKKIKITNGLGEDKPQIVIECFKVDYSIEKNVFELHLGKILEQKNILKEVEDEKDILIKQLLNEKQELMNVIDEIKKSGIFNK